MAASGLEQSLEALRDGDRADPGRTRGVRHGPGAEFMSRTDFAAVFGKPVLDPERPVLPVRDPGPRFDIVACKQGADAVRHAKQAAREGNPFDVIILDVRMPPGIDGVEAGSAIRKFDEDVEIVFVTGYSDIPLAELQRRVPPPMRLHYFNKPLSFSRLAQDVATIVREH